MNTGLRDDSRLHAYVDNELDVDDRAELLEGMYVDTDLRNQVCELRRVKDLVQQAYFVPPPPPSANRRASGFGQRRSLAACCAVLMLMVLSFAGGWLLHARDDAMTLLNDHLASLGAIQLKTADIGPGEPPRVLLHVATDNPAKFAGTLQQASYLLHKGGDDGIQVEVVANAGGLKLLEANAHSGFAKQVRDMMRKYPNLHFVACGITLHNLEAAGVPVDLIRHVRVAPSAVEEVVHRLRQGWMYVNL
ncbi:hypothetical protein BJI67_02990 [Acidihalobacter aeolianus]|uniref:DsrE/DsrF-like family protein n=1 Tax=Acidihalobacter aeolianus TaxID=2792603 RepID=A0A1D8K5D1_9GAMM|nr:hypothetical protein [Acidihalobacter aeolianus]AOV16169.1 hypothetical protein BJI67_02990 [Acidihalobacter aeolianus]